MHFGTGDIGALLHQLLSFEGVRRLLLNFLYFHRFNIFPPDFNVTAALRGCFNAVDAGLPAHELRNLLENNIATHFYSLLQTKMILETRPQPSVVYRVLDYNRLVGGTSTLLKPIELARRGVNFRDKSEDGQRELAKFVSNEYVVDSNLVMRGLRFPFAWMTDDDLVSALQSNGPAGAQYICQLLALTYLGTKNEVSLFLVQSPVNIGKARFRRPTPFDGFGGRFFKARTSHDTMTVPSPSGYTLSLAELRSSLPPFHNRSFDGVREFAVHDFTVQPGAICEWLGFFDPNWVEIDGTVVDQVLIGHADVDAQLSASVRVIAELLTDR